MSRSQQANLKTDYLILSIAGLMGLVVAIHWLFTSDPYVGSGTDILTFEYPFVAFAHSRLSQGDLPLWNPYEYGGNPYQLGAHSNVSPSYWTTIFLGPLWDIKVGFLLHYILGAVGMAWWIRGSGLGRAATLLAVGGFALSAFFAMHAYAGHRALFFSAAYAPWLIGSIERWRDGLLSWWVLGVAASCLLLSRHYHIIYITWLTVGIYCMIDTWAQSEKQQRLRNCLRLLAGMAAAVTVSVLVGAIQLIPTAETSSLSQRAQGGITYAASFSSAPLNLLSYISPTLFGNREELPFLGSWSYWESLGYFGVASVVLFVTAWIWLPAKRYVAAYITSTIAVLIALGMHTPFFEIYAKIIPGADMFRSPGRTLLILHLLGPLVAARCLDAWLNDEVKHTAKKRAAILFATLAVALGWATYTIRAFDKAGWSNFLGDGGKQERLKKTSATIIQSLTDVASGELFYAAIIVASLSVALLIARTKKHRELAAWALVLVSTFEVYQFSQPFLKTAPDPRFGLPQDLRDQLAQRAKPGDRMIDDPRLRVPHQGAELGVAHIGGYDTFAMNNVVRYLNVAKGNPVNAANSFFKVGKRNHLIDHFGARFVLTYSTASTTAMKHKGLQNWKRVWRNQKFMLFEDLMPSPRAYVVHDYLVREDYMERLKLLGNSKFPISTRTILSSPLPKSLEVESLVDDEGAEREEASIVSYLPDEVELKVSAASAGLMILSDTWHPGWNAYVDGKKVPVLEANAFMRAVPVPAGVSRVVMRFQPMSFTVGMWVSTCTIFLLGGIMLFRRRKAAKTVEA